MQIEEIPPDFQLLPAPAGAPLTPEARFISGRAVWWPPPELLRRREVALANIPPLLILDTEEWVRRILRPQWIAIDLRQRWRAAREIINGRDAFLVRYRLSESMIQIIVTRTLFELTVRLATAAQNQQDYKQYAEAFMRLFLLADDPDEGHEWTEVQWENLNVGGLLYGYQPRTVQLNWRESISYLTDGNAIMFVIQKLRSYPVSGGPPKSPVRENEAAANGWFDSGGLTAG